MGKECILKMEGISKSFPGVKALDQVNLTVRKGTVHAVMGENGAGKSTLMKILLGLYPQDEGTVYFKGKEVHFNNPRDALHNGLAMIHQELSTVRSRNVMQNIYLGKEITYKGTGVLNNKAMYAECKTLFESLGIGIDPMTPMSSLSVSRQQLCEIAKAISYNADLIIMDEPTSAITESEVELLFKMIDDLLKKGITIIYITHKMDEVFKIADDVSVYRDGHFINSVPAKETNQAELIKMMVGRELSQMFPKEEVEIKDTLLKVENLSSEGVFEDVSFELRRGEILGVAGLIGAGRSEVMEGVFGVRPISKGKIYINGAEVTIRTPRDAIRNRIAFLTEDRKHNGCLLPLSVRENTVIASLTKYCRLGFINRRVCNEKSKEMQKAMNIKTPTIEQKIMNLSGGNQQKVLVGRWLLTDPNILIVDEPTRGIDVGAKSEIHKLITNLAKQGKGIIMISSELPEVLGMSDRVMVMSEGKLIGTMNREEATQEKILLYATGKTE